jgi:hypothetical protein
MRRDRHNESNRHFLNFAKALKNGRKNVYYSKTQMEKARNAVAFIFRGKRFGPGAGNQLPRILSLVCSV